MIATAPAPADAVAGDGIGEGHKRQVKGQGWFPMRQPACT
jgi:hypothetical protein